MLVIVSGLPGSGKSSLVEAIAREFNLRKIFASGILKELAQRKIHEVPIESVGKGDGFWESEKGKELVKQRLQDGSLDKELDDKLLEIADEIDNVIIDSRTMPWLCKKGIKIWLDCSEKVRAERVAKRDRLPTNEVLDSMRERLESDKQIYKKLYGIDFASDLKPFHLVINNDRLDKRQTVQKAIEFIQQNKNKLK